MNFIKSIVVTAFIIVSQFSFSQDKVNTSEALAFFESQSKKQPDHKCVKKAHFESCLELFLNPKYSSVLIVDNLYSISQKQKNIEQFKQLLKHNVFRGDKVREKNTKNSLQVAYRNAAITSDSAQNLIHSYTLIPNIADIFSYLKLASVKGITRAFYSTMELETDFATLAVAELKKRSANNLLATISAFEELLENNKVALQLKKDVIVQLQKNYRNQAIVSKNVDFLIKSYFLNPIDSDLKLLVDIATIEKANELAYAEFKDDQKFAILAVKKFDIADTPVSTYYAYNLSKNKVHIDRAINLLASTPSSLETSIFKTYFNEQILNVSQLPSFFEKITVCKSCNVYEFRVSAMNIKGFSRKFQINTFLNSIEYKYSLASLIAQADIKYKYDYIDIELEYPKGSIHLYENASCDYKESKSDTRDIGLLETLFTFNANDKEVHNYDVYACNLPKSAIQNINNLVAQLPSQIYWSNINKLSQTWRAINTTSRYSYSTAPAPSQNLAGSTNSTSTSSNNSSNVNNERSSSSSSRDSGGLKEMYNGGYKSSQGNIIYIVRCNDGRKISAFKDSSGWWKDGSGSKLGEKYRHLSNQAFGNKYCT